jgi:hypothetical protein
MRIKSVTWIFLFIIFMVPKVSLAENQQGVFFRTGGFGGGEVVAGSGAIVVDRIRFGRHGDFDRLVFDVYTDDPLEPRKNPSSFSVSFKQDQTEVGVRLTAKPGSCKIDDLSGSSLIDAIKEKEYFDWMFYNITFKEPVEIAVYELSSPGRIVIDIRKSQ